jgi:hypothetical protein
MIRNEIVYTVLGRDGMRQEEWTVLDRRYLLTMHGAQQILRAERPTAIVTSVSPMVYA